MAKGLVTAELTGFKELIQSLKDMPEITQKAIEAGSKAMMEQGEKDLRNAYYAVGGKQGDYVDRGIGSYGTADPSGKLAGTDYWTSVGVFKKDDEYNYYNSLYADNQKGEIKREAMTAAQIAYWIENGTSRLKSGVRKPRNFVEAAFQPEELIKTTPKPFISNSFVTGWGRQYAAFEVAFNKTIEELT